MTATLQAAPAVRSAIAARDVTLLDLLDRLLAGGVVVHGQLTLSAANIDLVALRLMLVVGSVDTIGEDLRGPLAEGRI